jgi:hypothetical protein
VLVLIMAARWRNTTARLASLDGLIPRLLLIVARQLVVIVIVRVFVIRSVRNRGALGLFRSVAHG